MKAKRLRVKVRCKEQDYDLVRTVIDAYRFKPVFSIGCGFGRFQSKIRVTKSFDLTEDVDIEFEIRDNTLNKELFSHAFKRLSEMNVAKIIEVA